MEDGGCWGLGWRLEAGGWSLEVRGWRLEGERLRVGDWRLDWRLKVEVLGQRHPVGDNLIATVC